MRSATPLAPSSGIGRAAEWLESLGRSLVLLEGPAIGQLRTELEVFDRILRDHIAGAQGGSERTSRAPTATRRALVSDHERFETSLDQLWGLVRIVEHDGHGGNRQALGQYARIFAEALERHRELENGPAGLPDATRPRPSSRSSAGNGN